ncbi:MAG: hypothetical protein ACYTFI_21060 [Planctomycetota bacterium]|jgi:hypothetical protein
MTITDLLYFADGGTTAIQAVDARGREFAFCFDGMMSSATPERIFFGAVHPTRDGARLLPERSDDEKAILGLLRGWLDARLTTRRQAELLERRAVTGLPKQEYWALRVLRAFRRRYYLRKSRQWLNDNYSPEEQARLLRRPGAEGLGDEDRAAWHKVQLLHGYPVRRRKEAARRPALSTDAATE